MGGGGGEGVRRAAAVGNGGGEAWDGRGRVWARAGGAVSESERGGHCARCWVSA